MSPTYGDGQPAATWELQSQAVNWCPCPRCHGGEWMGPTIKWNPTANQAHRTLEKFHVFIWTHAQDVLWGFLMSLAEFRKNSIVREVCPHSPPSLPLGLGLNPSSMTSLTAWPWAIDLICMTMSFSFCKWETTVRTFQAYDGDWRVPRVPDLCDGCQHCLFILICKVGIINLPPH